MQGNYVFLSVCHVDTDRVLDIQSKGVRLRLEQHLDFDWIRRQALGWVR